LIHFYKRRITMMVILLLLFLGSIQHSGAKPSDSNINMNNVKIKTKPGSQHASANLNEQDTSSFSGNQISPGVPVIRTVNNAGPTHNPVWTGQCIQCKSYSMQPRGKTFTCDGRKYDLSHISCNNPRQGVTNNCISVTCDGRKVDLSQINPVSNGNDIRGQNGRNIDQNQNVQDFSGQTIRDGQTFNQVQGPGGNQQCLNGVCHPCRGSQTIRNGKVICDGKQVGTIDQNQNNPVWTGNDIRGQTFRGQDINQDQTNGFNSNTVRQGGRNNDMNQNDLLGPGGKDYDNYDIKDWINWANTIKQLQLFEEKGGKPSAGGEKGGEP